MCSHAQLSLAKLRLVSDDEDELQDSSEEPPGPATGQEQVVDTQQGSPDQPTDAGAGVDAAPEAQQAEQSEQVQG